MSKICTKCSKTVYPLEELKCLDKVSGLLNAIRHILKVAVKSADATELKFLLCTTCEI